MPGTGPEDPGGTNSGGSRRYPTRSRTNSLVRNASFETDHVPAKKMRTTANTVKESTSSETTSSNNPFQILGNDVEMPETDLNSQNRPRFTQNKRRRLPPFTIYKLDKQTIESILKNVTPDKNNAHMILSKNGIEVVLYEPEHYRELRKICKEKGIEFSDHPLEDEQFSNFVVYGLHESTEVDEIVTTLKAHGLNVMKIICLTKEKRDDGQVTYKLVFKATDKVSVDDLKQITAIGYLRVRFQRYYGNGKPTQCPNCLWHGHGSDHCGRHSRCIRCGDEHKSSECPKRTNKEDPKSRIPDADVKCANCAGNHTANFSKCPVKLKYIQDRELQRQRSANRASAKVRHTPQTTQSPPGYAKTNFATAANNNRIPSYSQAVKGNNDLLSIGELTNLVQQLQAKIRACRTRTDQIMTVFLFVMSQLSNDECP